MEFIKSLHAVSGLVVALTGLAQILFAKGGIRHAIVGITYLCAWLLVVITGAIMGSPLISLFGILGFYMAVTGWRFANRRRTTPKLFEKIIYVLGALVAVGTLFWGITLTIKGSMIGKVALFFGLIFTFSCIKDLKVFVFKKKNSNKPAPRQQWLFEHMTRMYISYIAAMTAFAVINKVFYEPIYNWIIPTIIGTLLIILSKRYQRKKMEQKESKELN